MARNNNLTDFLKDVADAIREKTNTAGSINPQDFPERIGAIDTTGGQPEGTHTVRFIDVDGTILKSHYVEDGGSATPPANPTREKCQFVKWLNAYDNITKDTDVFALYTSADGHSWYRVKAAANDRMNLLIRCDTTSPVTIDWGDGTTDTATNRSAYTVFRHDYAAAFDGWVKVSSEGNYSLNSGENDGNPCVIEVIVGDKVATLGAVARQMFNLRAIVIPDTVKDYEGNLFFHCLSLLSLALPDGVKKIVMAKVSTMTELRYVRLPETLTEMPANILGHSYSLQNISIPEGVTSIGASSFSNCYALQSIVIPEGVTSIETSAFWKCVNLHSVVIPASVTSIGNSAFADCVNLRDVKILGSLTSIRDSVFSGCYSLQNISIPEGVTSIGASSFSNCYALQSIVIPEGVTSIGASAFRSCANALINGLPVSLTKLDSMAFAGCGRLTGAVSLPAVTGSLSDTFAQTGIVSFYATATTLTRTSGYGALGECLKLVRVELPNVVTFGAWACRSDTALELVILGDSVTRLESASLASCTALERLVVKAATPPTLASNALQGTSALSGIYVPDASVEAYKTATNWSAFADIIKPLSDFVE